MVISNEPGYYEAGNFGIRIENLLVVVQKPELGEFAGKGFLGFEKLTMIPIQKKLMNVALLTSSEISWINNYHAKVRDNIGSQLRSEKAKAWLFDATSPI
jgi:Xaa-Pro aminopeptidase